MIGEKLKVQIRHGLVDGMLRGRGDTFGSVNDGRTHFDPLYSVWIIMNVALYCCSGNPSCYRIVFDLGCN